MDQAVVAAYGWEDVDLRHDIRDTEQSTRFTLGPAVRHEVLERLLELNHQHYAEEVTHGLHAPRKQQAKRKSRPGTSPTAQADLYGTPVENGRGLQPNRTSRK